MSRQVGLAATRLLLIVGMAITAALLVTRISTSNIAASLAPPMAMAVDDVLETPDAADARDSPGNVIVSNVNHQRVVFEYVSSDSASWDIFLADGQMDQVRQITTNRADDRFPVLSPDGNSIAFVSWRDGNSEIYVIDIESGVFRNISNHPAYDLLPVWSPDGSMLAFVSNRDGNGEIYLADIDRGLVQNLTHMPSHEISPQWSPDGAWIRFRSYREVGWNGYLISLDGKRSLVMASHPQSLELNR